MNSDQFNYKKQNKINAEIMNFIGNIKQELLQTDPGMYANKEVIKI